VVSVVQSRPETTPLRLMALGARPLVFTLAAVNLCNFMDRKLISVLLPAIKHDLKLTDSEIGLMTGLAFAVIYASLGVPLSWISERIDRRRMIAAVLTVWCAMTALSGAAGSFFHLMLCRMGVAVGEAGASPPAYAMISDAYPTEQRAFAISIYTAGGAVGGFFGALLGGWIAQIIGWRAAFAIVGLIGVVLVPVLLFAIKDPPRGGSDNLLSHQAVPMMAATRRIWRVKSFRQNVIAGSLYALVTYSLTTWLPSVLVRSYGVSIGEAGTILGLMTLVGGAGGALLGGQLTGWLGRKDLRWWPRICGMCFLIGAPLIVMAFMIPNIWATVTGVSLAYALTSVASGTSFASLNTTVPPRVRATASASALLVITGIGLGLGPLLTGVASDYFNAAFKQDGLRMALVVPAVASLWASLHYFLMVRTIRGDAAAAIADGG
jgi:MFS family permease